MKLNFFKMHAQGNDYIYFDFLENKIPDIDFPKLSRKISNRHLGVGSDGIVIILEDLDSDAFMRIFNSDGSEGKMCGSALKCISSYLAKKTGKKELKINTVTGIKTGLIMNEELDEVKINMGTPELIGREPIEIENFKGYLVQTGNKHFVTFVEKFTPDIANRYGPIIEANTDFPDGINVEFVKINSRNSIFIKIWELGSGETLACGTGACAVVYAGVKMGLLDNIINVIQPGGTVLVEYDGSDIFLTGKVNYIFSGTYEI
ncbi:MAG: diaminopimelate epimerase [Candidatus Cloacimonetes bacterium]|nr:diaminopimelate epimerase [Candidatus Cloacimonadota bacterium]